MGLFSTIVERISDHPVLFIFIRGLLENDFKAIKAIIRRELKVGQGLSTLDLGCGPGAFAPVFDGDDYMGADLNARYVEYAKRRYKRPFLCSDARALKDVPDARFDQVLIFGLLHHLSDDDVRAVLREATRVVKPGGHILAVEDIPAISKLNLIGHLVHHAENGEHIRPADDYRRLYNEYARVEREEILQSGICDYYAAILVA